MSQTLYTPTTTPSPAPDPIRGRRDGRRAGTAALVAVLLVGALAAGLAWGRRGGTGETAPAVAAGGPTAGPAVASSPPPSPSPSPSSGGASAPSSGTVSTLEPQPQPQPQASPGILAVGPSVVDLPSGVWTADFVVSNVGGSDMAWLAVGVPSALGLSSTQGSLAAGEETTVTATVDHTKLVKGPFSLTLHVSANDTAAAVTITGTKQVKVAVPPGPGNLTPVTKP